VDFWNLSCLGAVEVVVVGSVGYVVEVVEVAVDGGFGCFAEVVGVSVWLVLYLIKRRFLPLFLLAKDIDGVL
jgi:hypothetical protein